MKAENKQNNSLTMRKIFTHMIESGYNPRYEDGYILFDIEDNMSVLEYENGVLTIRTFFTIDEDGYDMFLEASNFAMIKSFMIKPVIMEDMKSIMFSSETLCENLNDFKRFLPRLIEFSKTGLQIHKNEMRELLKATDILSQKMPAEDRIIETGKSRGKLLS
jgi:hypothetical protein